MDEAACTEPEQPGDLSAVDCEGAEARVTGSFCCVPECSSSYGKDTSLSYHDIPKENQRRKAWVHAIRRDVGKGFQITEKVTKVCGRHFLEADYFEPSARAIKRRSSEGKGGKAKRRLKPDAVPSVFDFPSTKKIAAGTRKAPKGRVFLVPSSDDDDAGNDSGDAPSPEITPTAEELKAECDVLRKENTRMKKEIMQMKDAMQAMDIQKVHRKVDSLQDQLLQREHELDSAKKSTTFNIHRFTGKAHMVRVFTGFTSISMFMACFTFLQPDAEVMYTWQGGRTKFDKERHRCKSGPKPKLSLEDQFFFVCARLRTGHTLDEMEDRLQVDSTTLSRYFTTWINLLYRKFSDLLVFPSRRRTDRHMPECFRLAYPSTRVIIDCTEFFIERPSNLAIQSSSFSAYKNCNTVKSLLGISPDGAFTFVSPLYEGSISDKDIVVDSGFLPLLDHGDSVMADKGFDVQDVLAAYGVRLNIPPFNTKAHQMLPQDVVATKSIASVRIHVERAIKRVKEFRLLAGTIDNNMFDLLQQMVFSVCMLCNFQPALVSR